MATPYGLAAYAFTRDLSRALRLGEALEAFNADSTLRQALGEEFCQAYENLRRRQWQRERGDISHTERRACLDC